MDARELMMGDWVRVIPYKKNGRIYRIDYTYGKGNEYVGVIDGDFDIGLLEPIPLTPEILEKNGFKKCNEDTDGSIQYEYGDDKLGVDVWFIPNNPLRLLGAWRKWNDCNIPYDMINELPIRFVHELQHALRLCGIDKDIVL